jgi:hypothetical protein
MSFRSGKLPLLGSEDEFLDHRGIAFVLIILGAGRIWDGQRVSGWTLLGAGLLLDVLATGSGLVGCLPWDWRGCLNDGQEYGQHEQFHNAKLVTQKHLTSCYLCNTVIGMANVLSIDKQIGVISALAEAPASAR